MRLLTQGETRRSGRLTTVAMAALAVVALLVAAAPPAEAARERAARNNGAVLMGTVTDALGLAVADARLAFHPADITSGDNARSPVATTRTDATGAFRVPVGTADGLPEGTYAVVVRASGQPVTWYGGASTPERATPLQIDAATAITPIAIAMRQADGLARVQGVARSMGDPVRGMFVSAYRTWGAEIPAATVPTDDAGRYLLHVPPGSYKLVADGSSLGLLRRWSSGRSAYEVADVFDVTAGQTLTMGFQVHPLSTLPRQPNRSLPAPRGRFRDSERPIDDVLPYQPQRTCRSSPQPGTLALRRLLLATYGSETVGIMRACPGDTSEHKDGRALDWMVNAGVPSDALKADNFTRWATRSRGTELGAMARRLGIMYIIWRGRIWGQYDAAAGWRVYRRCDDPDWPGRWQCHFDHVHISLNKPGGRRLTSWWTGRPWQR